MKSQFAQVLANENEWLTAVSDRTQLAEWRDRVVKEVMTPGSPYALALRTSRDVQERAEFLSRWRELIAGAIGRIFSQEQARPRSTTPTGEPAHDTDGGPGEPQKIAVLILAALHGGCTLSHVTQDQWPLDAALDIALAPFANYEEPRGSGTPDVQHGQ
jgi:hypothetical protein